MLNHVLIMSLTYQRCVCVCACVSVCVRACMCKMGTRSCTGEHSTLAVSHYMQCEAQSVLL